MAPHIYGTLEGASLRAFACCRLPQKILPGGFMITTGQQQCLNGASMAPGRRFMGLGLRSLGFRVVLRSE